jgi:hypothetical protein
MTLKKTSNRLCTANPIRSSMLHQAGITRHTALQIPSRGRPAILEFPTHSLTKMMIGHEVALGQDRQRFILEHRVGKRLALFRIQMSKVTRASLYHILIRHPRMAGNQGGENGVLLVLVYFYGFTICIL